MSTWEIINKVRASDICVVGEGICLTGRNWGAERLLPENDDLKAFINAHRIARIDVDVNDIGEDCVIIELEKE